MMKRIVNWLSGPQDGVKADSSGHTLEELAGIYGINTGALPAVNQTTAMKVSAVYACVSLIAGTIASLPIHVYARTQNGRERADHDYWWLLNEQPNENVSAAVFWEFIVSCMLLRGVGYAEIKRTSFRSSRINSIEAWNPDRVFPFKYNNIIYYRVSPEEGEQYIVHPSDMLIFPTIGYDGLKALSPITYAARQAISISMSAGQHSANFFANDAKPSIALIAPGKLSKEDATMMREQWQNLHGGPSNSGKAAILHGGLALQQLTMSAEDAQLIATQSFQVEEIARVFGVPLHLIQHTEKTTSWGSGIESMSIAFSKFTLSKHINKIKQEINRKFWPVRQRLFVEHNLDGLERGDIKTRYEAFRIALGRAGEPGWMTQNEVRKLSNLPPKEEETADKLSEGKKNDSQINEPAREQSSSESV